MSQANVELVRRGYEAWGGRDLDAFLELLAPDFESRPFTDWGDLKDLYRGPDGWRSFWATWEEAWESIEVAVERVEDLNERVLALMRFDRTGRHSGTPVSIAVGHVWTFREGQVTHILALPWAEALEAVGLSPE
jgi:ketosteroid isomerase-like protein